MKKFTSLFALLSCLCVVSAQAEDLYYVPTVADGEVSIFYEANNNPDAPNIYLWVDGSNNPFLENQWPGVAMEYVGKNSNNKSIYKWTKPDSQNWTPTHLIITATGNDGNIYKITGENNIVFQNNAYFIDGGLNHIVADGPTVYFYKSNDLNWNNVYLYAFDSRQNKYKVNWPGIQMEHLGNNLYKAHIDECTFTNIIFNNGGTGDGNQTPTLTAADGTVYVPDGTYNNYNNPNVFTADASLEVSDGVNFPFNKDFAVLDASYTRSNVTSEWGTLCLPFGFNVSNQQQLTTQDVTFYSFSDVDPAARTINFSQINNGEVSPGQAVLFKLSSSEGRLSIRANNGVSVTSAPQSGESVGFYGTFVEARKNNVYYISANQFYFGSNILIKPYRGIVENAQGPSEQSGGAPFRFTVDDTEDIQFVEQEDGTVKAYYDLQGRKLDGARKGLVIENGKIIMVK